MAEPVIEIQKLYVAYFGRPADPDGLEYWTDMLANNTASLQDISHEFAASAEYHSKFDGMNNRAIVTEIYDNLFGREAEATGVDYWAGLMDRGVISIDDVVRDISEAAVDGDEVAFSGKVAAAGMFTLRLDEPDEIAAYAGSAANNIAMEYIATVRDLESAFDALKPSVVDAWIERMEAAQPTGMDEVELVGVVPVTEPLPVY